MMILLTVQRRSILIWSTIAYYWAALFTNYDSVSAFTVVVAPYHINSNGLTSHCRKNNVVAVSRSTSTSMIIGMTQKTTDDDEKEDDGSVSAEDAVDILVDPKEENLKEETKKKTKTKEKENVASTKKKKTTKEKENLNVKSNKDEEEKNDDDGDNVETSMIIGMTQKTADDDEKEDDRSVSAEDAVDILVDPKEENLKEETKKKKKTKTKEKENVASTKNKKTTKEKESLKVKSNKDEEEEKNDDDGDNVETKKKKVGRPRGSNNLPVKNNDGEKAEEKEKKKEKEITTDITTATTMVDNNDNKKKGGDVIPVKVTYNEVLDVSRKFFEATIDIVGKIGGPAIKAALTTIESNRTKEVFGITVDAFKLVSASIDKNKTTEILKSSADLAGKLGGSAIKIVSEAIDSNETKEVLDAAIKVASAAIGDININIMKLPKEQEIIDVSIPYNSASLLAYTEWLVTNGKEEDLESDEMKELRFGYFETNYKKVTIANVVAKKKITDRLFRKSIESKLLFEAKGDVVEEEKLRKEFKDEIELEIKPIELDQYADLSPTEYIEMMKSLEPKTLVGLLVDLASYTGKAALNVATSTVEGTKKNDSRGSSSGSRTVFVKKKKKSTTAKAQVSGGNAAKVQKKKIPNKSIVSSNKNKKQDAVKKPMFSFGGIKKITKLPPNKQKTTLKPSAATRLQQKKKAAVAPKKRKVVGGVPELSKWKQNKDGSITGLISNSPSFTTGTRITTSPIPKGAKSGSLVRTSSGSRYKLN